MVLRLFGVLCLAAPTCGGPRLEAAKVATACAAHVHHVLDYVAAEVPGWPELSLSLLHESRMPSLEAT